MCSSFPFSTSYTHTRALALFIFQFQSTRSLIPFFESFIQPHNMRVLQIMAHQRWYSRCGGLLLDIDVSTCVSGRPSPRFLAGGPFHYITLKLHNLFLNLKSEKHLLASFSRCGPDVGLLVNAKERRGTISGLKTGRCGKIFGEQRSSFYCLLWAGIFLHLMTTNGGTPDVAGECPTCTRVRMLADVLFLFFSQILRVLSFFLSYSECFYVFF